MKLIDSTRTVRLQRGLSARSFVIIMAVALAVLAGGGYALYYFNFTQAERAEREARQLDYQKKHAQVERDKGAEQSRIALARNQQNEALVRARQVTNSLAALLQEINALNADLSAFKTNEEGKSVALHPDLIPLARRLYENQMPQLPAASEVLQRLESARRVEQQLVEHAGSAYEPEAQLTVNLQDASYWAETTSRRAHEIRTAKEFLVREAKVKIAAKPLDDNSPSLETALKQLTGAENRQQQQLIIEKTDDAKKQAADQLAKAEAKTITDDAELKAKRMIEDAQAKVREYENELLTREALRRSNEIRVQREAKRIYSDADKKVLSDKASQPDVQAKLAPFISKGYWTTKTKSKMYPGALEKKPLSYTELQGFGALEPNFDGLQKLVSIGIDRDNDRPRWENIKGPSAFSWRRSPEKVQFVQDAQKLLIELGPVLVEMNLLSE